MKVFIMIENMIKMYIEVFVKVMYKDGSVEEMLFNYNQFFFLKDKIVDNKGELIVVGILIDVNGDLIID